VKSISNLNQKMPAEILIIDDEESICEFFKDLFEIYNVNIDIELSGTSGLKKISRKNYNLIFLDIMLGDANGIDLLKAIKQRSKETKIIMISAYLTEQMIEKALKNGADGYLYKPISVRDILAVSMRWIKL